MKQIFKSKLVWFLIIIILFLINLKLIINKVIVKNEQTNKVEEIKPTITVIKTLPTPIIINGLTPEEINNLKGEEYDVFVDRLSEEQWNYLIPLKYEFDLPYEEDYFYVEKYENNNLYVKPKNTDKNKVKEALYGWLYFDKGQNPEEINIIWNE